MTEKPALPKAIAAINPARPPPEINISAFSITHLPFLRFQHIT
jgi:hypothetical protein